MKHKPQEANSKSETLEVEFKPHLLPTAIGSMPHRNAQRACELVLKNFSEIPVWPQLPKTSFLENMYVQYTEGMPGVVVDRGEERVYFDVGSRDFRFRLESFYEKYLAGEQESFAISREYAQGFYAMLNLLKSSGGKNFQFIKGQVTGPVSMGLAITDEAKKPILYNEEVIDAIAKVLAMKARWQEEVFKKHFPHAQVIIFFDEPYLSSFGSAYVSLSKEKAVSLINEVAKAVRGIVGVHCCGNTDWSILTQADIDVISFDAYGFADNLALYQDEIKKFHEKGGVVAWGIVPSSEKVNSESITTLGKLLEEKINLLIRSNINRETLLEASLITPSCGVGSLSVELSEKILGLTRHLSEGLRERFFDEYGGTGCG